MNADDFVEALYQETKKQGIKEFQIEYYYSDRQSLSISHGKLEQAERSEGQEISLKVRENGKIGSVSYEAPFEENFVAEIVKSAHENAMLITDKDDNFFYDGSGNYCQDLEPYVPLTAELDKMDKIDYLQKLEQAAYDFSSKVDNVMHCSYGEGKTRVILRNSLGLNVSREVVSAGAGIYLSVKDGNEIKVASDSVIFDKETDFNPEKLAQNTVKKALEKLHAIDFKSGLQSCIIENKAFRSLLAAVLDACSAQAIIEKMSKFEGMLNKQVASPIVSIVEDPFMKGGLATKSFDDEGYPTSRKEIICDGVLKTYLHNLKTAHRFGVKPTGNGRNSVTNVYLKAGDMTNDELLLKINNAILIRELSGLHVGLDLVSGDFSAVGNGCVIQNGKKGTAVTQFTVAGNLYDVLKNIRYVSNDLDFDNSHIGSPSVWVDKLTLSNR